MSATAKHPRAMRPKFTAPEQTELIANEMLLLRLFPDHMQVEEFRHNVEWARLHLPALHAHAEIIVGKKLAEDGRLASHPEECPRCEGAGIFEYLGRMRFCGCPAGELASRTQTLPDPPPPHLAVTPKPLSPRKQLEQLRSLFEGDADA